MHVITFEAHPYSVTLHINGDLSGEAVVEWELAGAWSPGRAEFRVDDLLGNKRLDGRRAPASDRAVEFVQTGRGDGSPQWAMPSGVLVAVAVVLTREDLRRRLTSVLEQL